jgi:hypothetical protein
MMANLPATTSETQGYKEDPWPKPGILFFMADPVQVNVHTNKT